MQQAGDIGFLACAASANAGDQARGDGDTDRVRPQVFALIRAVDDAAFVEP